MNKMVVMIIFQIVIIFIIVSIITLFIKIKQAVKIEKRIERYCIKPTKSINYSYFDRVKNGYVTFVKMQRKKINKLFPNLVKKYDKYVTDGRVRAVDYVTNKLIISLAFIIFTILAMTIQGKLVTLFQIFLSFILGFYILDLFLIIYGKFKMKRIEDDFLKAIIIMNNAFKSGKSTIQAVEIASEKLPRPINLEFKRILQELEYGLSPDVVFDRFAKRINSEAAEYVSSSLMILNRTGGNIVAVFNSIEKTLFDKQKLREELKQSTMVSSLVTKILLLVPLLIVLIIYILDPTYFNPFFNSTLGYILFGLAVILFIIYAYLLGKIVKVDGLE